VIITTPFDDVARADADAYAERDVRTLVALRNQPLNFLRRRNRVASPRKHRHKTVAHALHDLTVMRRDRPADERIVLVSYQVESILPQRNE
jgi:hypothetical protein